MVDYDIADAFKAIEDELIASMMRNMKRHRAEETAEGIEWSMWQAEQLKALEKYKKENQKKYKKQFKDINNQIEVLLRQARAEGNMQQELEILKAIKNGFHASKLPAGVSAGFFRLNDRKLDALIEATTNDMETAETAVLRMADDQYRKTIFNAQVYANTGAGTYEKAVDMATRDFLAAGLNCIVYANGARHTLSDYADMAIRTASKRAYLQGEGEKRKEWGITTVIVNKRGNPCPKCLPFCGKVLIDDVWSGGRKDGVDPETGKKYPLMSYAVSKGLYHPRCKDSHTTYFPGISTADDTWTQKELEEIGLTAKEEAKQQYAERQAEKYDRLAKYSLDKENQEKYQGKVRQWRSLYSNDEKSKFEENLPRYSDRILGTLNEKIGKFVEKDGASDIMKLNSGILKMNLQLFGTKEKQFGKKIGKHAQDYGLNPAIEADRIKMKEIIQDIQATAEEIRTGDWRGYPEDVLFHIKGNDVVVTKTSGEFITILKGGVTNARVKNARKC